jgi:hypothetical protein
MGVHLPLEQMDFSSGASARSAPSSDMTGPHTSTLHRGCKVRSHTSTPHHGYKIRSYISSLSDRWRSTAMKALPDRMPVEEAHDFIVLVRDFGFRVSHTAVFESGSI